MLFFTNPARDQTPNVVILWVVVFIASVAALPAQYLKHNGAGKSDWWVLDTGTQTYQLENKVFDFGEFNGLLTGDRHLAKYLRSTPDQTFFKAAYRLNIRECQFRNHSCVNPKLWPVAIKALDLSFCRTNFFSCSVVTSEMNHIFYNKEIPNFYLHHSTGTFYFDNNYFDFCHIFRSQLSFVEFSFCHADSSYIKIDSSTIRSVSIRDNYVKHLQVLFSTDTLNGYVTIRNHAQSADTTRLVIFIDSSYVNAHIEALQLPGYSKIVFNDCRFGPGADLSEFDFDSIVFNNCKFLDKVYLSLRSEKGIYLSVLNTDLSNLQFNIDSNLHLYFDASVRPDLVTNTYENLLSKLKHEGKFESYRNVDIAYRQDQFSRQGRWGSVKNCANWLWWNYGYNKGYVLYWTFGFLMVFFFVNLRNWNKMQPAYPVIPLEYRHRRSAESKFNFWIRKRFSVFIYTALIFFSLRIDFDKINYKHSGVILWFFFQYLTGLVCLLFIANAILKFE